MNAVALRLAARIFDQPLIQNQYRSAFVEAMIEEPYLASSGWRYTGDGWSGWDFERSDGARLEVKQSAARQTWTEARQQQPTRGIFDIASRTGYFYEGGAKYTAGSGRPAQLYVFGWNPVFGPDKDHPDDPRRTIGTPISGNFTLCRRYDCRRVRKQSGSLKSRLSRHRASSKACVNKSSVSYRRRPPPPGSPAPLTLSDAAG
jgi:hypothetical protein